MRPQFAGFRVDQTREHIEASGLTVADKKSRLAALDKSRQTLLGHADTLNNLLFQRRQQQKEKPVPRLGQQTLGRPETIAP